LLGAFLAFYAFIGFEDMVNVAEEIKYVERNLPRAIILVLILVSVLYFAVATVAVLAVAPAQLASSAAPLAMIYQHTTGQSPFLISIIGIFAVVNGALVQIIMASRVLYGMANQGWLPGVFGHVNRRTRTPDLATLLVTATILLLALFLPLVTLAKMTSFITLLIFILIHLSLLAIKWRGDRPNAVVCYPVWIPLGGVLSCLLFLGYQIWHWIF
jgi:amino acid transporter